ncbi:MAG: cupredoxin domain-containing protein [Actinomycetota bacterium]
MSKRIILGISVAALLGAACSTLPVATVSYGTGTEFIPMVADNLDDVGLGSSIALDKDGVAYVSYLGFTEKPKPDAIPIPRPLLNPGVPSVLITSEKGSIWTRGAAAVAVPAVSGIVWPYSPATVSNLKNILPTNTNGTDVVIGADGAPHTVWTGPDGVWEVDGGTAGLTSVASQVLAVDPPLSIAGQIGRPSIALDAGGTPWVAFTSTASGTGEVDVATPGNKGWDITTVATFDLCNGCPQAGDTKLLETPDGLVVAYVDPRAGVMIATQPSSGSAGSTTGSQPAWPTERVAPKVAGIGLDAVAAKDGTIYTSYYTGDGTVGLASGTSGSWTTTKVADVTDPDKEAVGNDVWTTGVAVDETGAVSVTWYDKETDAVKLASGKAPSDLAPVDTPGTLGGTAPALAVSPDGVSTYLSWYDVSTTSLLVGILGPANGVAIAEPSPTPTAVAQAAAACTPEGTTLKISASGTAFDKTCLAATAGKPFTIVFDNQDSGIPHNVSIYDGTNTLFAKSPQPGPGTVTYPVPALDAGTYTFQCDVHPTVMFGTFIVSK